MARRNPKGRQAPAGAPPASPAGNGGEKRGEGAKGVETPRGVGGRPPTTSPQLLGPLRALFPAAEGAPLHACGAAPVPVPLGAGGERRGCSGWGRAPGPAEGTGRPRGDARRFWHPKRHREGEEGRLVLPPTAEEREETGGGNKRRGG